MSAGVTKLWFTALSGLLTLKHEDLITLHKIPILVLKRNLTKYRHCKMRMTQWKKQEGPV